MWSEMLMYVCWNTQNSKIVRSQCCIQKKRWKKCEIIHQFTSRLLTWRIKIRMSQKISVMTISHSKRIITSLDFFNVRSCIDILTHFPLMVFSVLFVSCIISTYLMLTTSEARTKFFVSSSSSSFFHCCYCLLTTMLLIFILFRLLLAYWIFNQHPEIQHSHKLLRGTVFFAIGWSSLFLRINGIFLFSVRFFTFIQVTIRFLFYLKKSFAKISTAKKREKFVNGTSNEDKSTLFWVFKV